jgi:hypothetical protein
MRLVIKTYSLPTVEETVTWTDGAVKKSTGQASIQGQGKIGSLSLRVYRPDRSG